MKYSYLVVIEKGPTSYGAYAPDVPGCGTSGDTPEEALANIQEALELYLESTIEAGEAPPQPSHVKAQFVDVELEATAPGASSKAS
jgi:predicted RNase H-like HicB family nuclease